MPRITSPVRATYSRAVASGGVTQGPAISADPNPRTAAAASGPRPPPEAAPDIRSTKGTVSYALLPVWTLSTEYKGQKYLYVMNGQTGRIIGTVPWSKPKFWSFVIGLTVVLTAVATFVTTYLV